MLGLANILIQYHHYTKLCLAYFAPVLNIIFAKWYTSSSEQYASSETFEYIANDPLKYVIKIMFIMLTKYIVPLTQKCASSTMLAAYLLKQRL